MDEPVEAVAVSRMKHVEVAGYPVTLVSAFLPQVSSGVRVAIIDRPC